MYPTTHTSELGDYNKLSLWLNLKKKQSLWNFQIECHVKSIKKLKL